MSFANTNQSKSKIQWKNAIDAFTSNKEPFRCKKCGKLLAYEKILIGTIEIKCTRCKVNNNIYFDSIEELKKIMENT